MDMTVLERLKWLQQEQQRAHMTLNNVSSSDPFQFLQFNSSGGRDLKKLETFLGYNDLGHFPISGSDFGAEFSMGFVPSSDPMDGCISRTNSCQIEAVDATTIMMKEEEGEVANLNKRKAEFEVGKESRDKKMKREVEGEASIKGKANNNSTNKTDISSETSKENSKASETQKQDYIHVRARRGQATDRHSLAERARREKISKKMKCLQDLVPGCSKITGKAGMLDEIINYVQSLQRQVEFLSMKLAVMNPTLEFEMDDLAAKQFPAYMANFPFSPLQKGAFDFLVIDPNQTATQQNMMPPKSKVEPSSTLNTHSQNYYSISNPTFQY